MRKEFQIEFKDNQQLIDAIDQCAQAFKQQPQELERLPELIRVLEEPDTPEITDKELTQRALDFYELLAMIRALHELNPQQYVVSGEGVEEVITSIRQYRPVVISSLQKIRSIVH